MLNFNSFLKKLKKFTIQISCSMLFVFAAFFAHAASFSSVQSGNWNDPATWHAGGTGAIPGATDNATLSTGHSIVVSDNRTVGRLIVNGTSRSLSINTNMTLTVLGTISLASSVDQNWCLGDGFLRFSGDGDRGDGGGVAGSDLGFSGSAASIGSYNTNINLIVDLTNSTDTVRIPQTFVCKSLEIVRGVLKISSIQIMTGSSARNLYFNTTANGTGGSISIASNGRLMVGVVGRRVNGSSTEVASSFIETLTVNGILELRSAGSGTGGGFAAKNVTVNGTFIIKNTAGSAVVSSPTDAIVWGNNSILEYQSNSGSFQNLGAEISRNGGSVPTIGSVVINVQGATEEIRTFSRSLKIRNELKFINGKLNFGAGSEKITLLSTAIISGYGNTKYVYFSGTTSSSNKGFIKEGIANNANFLFPVGTNATNYTPITLTNRSGASLDYEISIVLPALTTNVSNFTAISGYEGHLNGEWNMGKVGGGASNVDILLEYGSLAFTGTFHNDHAQFVHHPNGNGTVAWETPLVSTYNGNSVKVSNYTGTFSPFAVGDFGRSMVLLPVELIILEGKAVANSVLLTWITASERNNDYFTLEKSVDGKNWSELTTIDGAGNSSSKNYYEFLDGNVVDDNLVYYRLKQTDFNGEYEYLKTILFEKELANFEAELYPNPVQNQLTINANSLIENLSIKNSLGQIVYSENQIPAGKIVLQLNNLTSGNYLIQFQTENQVYNKSFVKL
jgi:hypothetical protein